MFSMQEFNSIRAHVRAYHAPLDVELLDNGVALVKAEEVIAVASTPLELHRAHLVELDEHVTLELRAQEILEQQRVRAAERAQKRDEERARAQARRELRAERAERAALEVARAKSRARSAVRKRKREEAEAKRVARARCVFEQQSVGSGPGAPLIWHAPEVERMPIVNEEYRGARGLVRVSNKVLDHLERVSKAHGMSVSRVAVVCLIMYLPCKEMREVMAAGPVPLEVDGLKRLSFTLGAGGRFIGQRVPSGALSAAVRAAVEWHVRDYGEQYGA